MTCVYSSAERRVKLWVAKGKESNCRIVMFALVQIIAESEEISGIDIVR